MIKLIDTLSYSNALRPVSPLWKCGFAAALLLLSYVTHPQIQLCILLWMLIWIIGYAGIPAKYCLLLLGSSCLFYLASLPALIVEFKAWTIYISDNGVQTVAVLFCRMIACLSAMLFIILTTPISQLLQVMRKLRVPALVLELMLITYRFLFLFLDTAQDMYVAQRARGGQYGFKSKLRDTAVIVVRLFAKTMQRYRGLSHGLISRGFTDEIKPAPYEAGALPLRFRLEMGIGIVILLLGESWLRWGM
ncbi:cobalt ECF transporter T component CbiQ [Paenibacillus oenotherae]|uniref:Cobalt ECF transporter T component CbiQ n=1 Tax=Paenibacillus oenotherae TaxID=1435645 RepID=A0ABS7DCC7_9BACL|nr:cobalt ECF transporter T component CbiQ [Paenibacillus oenotherae]MBW7477291.1 cobalt ECF transporter T component CbiQ [Paenibacillus oenotherae]